MHITRAKLRNVGLLREIEVEFEQGLIGLFGPQGSGKSTLMNMIYANLTNDFGRQEGGKEGAVCQQRPEDEVSEIVGSYVHKDTPFEISRLLAPTAKNKLVGLSEKPIVKAGEIQAKLDEFLGVEKAMLDKYVFVEQWGVRQLFQLTAGERAKTLSRLCGTEWSEKCWESVSRRLQADESLATSQEIDLDRLKVRVEEVRVELQKALGCLQAAQDKLCTDEEATVMSRRLIVLTNYRTLIARREQVYTQERREFEEAATVNRTAKQASADAKRQASDSEVLIEALTHEAAAAAAYEEAAALWSRRSQAVSNREAAEAFVKAVVAPKSPLAPSVDKLRKTRDDIMQEMAPYSMLLSKQGGLTGSDVCPTCGQSLQDVEAQLAKARKALEALRKKLTVYDDQLALWTTYEAEVKTFQRETEQRQRKLSQLDGVLEELSSATPPGDKPEHTATELRVKIAETRGYVKAFESQAAKASEARATAVARHQASKKALADLDEEIAAQDVDPKRLDGEQLRLENSLTERSRALSQAAVAEAEAKLHQKTLAEREESLRLAEQTASNRQKAKHWIDTLVPVRNVLHRDSLPSLVHRQALRTMESSVNEMLEQFDSPFLVTASDDLSYTCHFRNGTVMPAKGLSGGQQVTLAIAFRWALNANFAGELGMMVLDEPTAGLDERHIELLEAAFTGIATAAVAKDFQVIVITHDARLERAFNQVIRLKKAVD